MSPGEKTQDTLEGRRLLADMGKPWGHTKRVKWDDWGQGSQDISVVNPATRVEDKAVKDGWMAGLWMNKIKKKSSMFVY